MAWASGWLALTGSRESVQGNHEVQGEERPSQQLLRGEEACVRCLHEDDVRGPGEGGSVPSLQMDGLRAAPPGEEHMLPVSELAWEVCSCPHSLGEGFLVLSYLGQ